MLTALALAFTTASASDAEVYMLDASDASVSQSLTELTVSATLTGSSCTTGRAIPTSCADGDAWVINGDKYYASGAGDPRCKIMIVMVKTDPNAETFRQQSQILVPKSTPGVTLVRPLTTLGYDDMVMELACGLHNFRSHCHLQAY